MVEPSSCRILVIGAGGIGGIIAGNLSELGYQVTALTTNKRIADAVSARGFRLRGQNQELEIKGRIETELRKDELFDYILLATQPPQVEDAAIKAAAHLAKDGHMVVLQNGLCEKRIQSIVGADRVIGAVVAWGASMPEAGLYDRTSAGGFVIGKPGKPPDKACHQLASILESVGPVESSDNLLGARWSKLALNCAISSLGTIGGDRLGPLVRVRPYRRLGLEIISETTAVAQAEGIALQKVAGTIDLGWVSLSEQDRQGQNSPSLAAKHALLLAVGMRYRRLRSSMLAAIERGRPPSVDFLNGEVVQAAKDHHISVPVNERIVKYIHLIARGELNSSRALLDQLYEETRES